MKKWIDKKPEIRKFSKTEASWLAGVIDGEGSIGIYNYGSEGRRVQVQVGNTHEGFVARFREVIGCGSSIMRTDFGASHKGRKPMYHFTLKGSNRCYWVLIQVIPYLIIKKDLAERIVKELEEKPFGRWKNATPESKAKQSLLTKKSWLDPIKRKNRIDGMNKRFARIRKVVVSP